MEFTAKTVEEAVTNGLKELNLEIDNAIITVKQEPKKGLFGRIKGNAVVEITAKVEEKPKKEKKAPAVKAKAKAKKAEITDNGEKDFVIKLLDILGVKAEVEVSCNNGNEVITIKTEDQSEIIGYRGEVLDAIQTLAGAVKNIGKKDYEKVVVDCENYRNKREETLVKLAHKLENKAIELKREVYLEPMNPFERRIIHMALAESTGVTTKSDGKEPNRFVIIVPNEKDEFARPYNAGVNHGDNRDRRNNNRNSRGGKNFRSSSPARKSSGGAKKSQASSFGTFLGNSKDLNA